MFPGNRGRCLAAARVGVRFPVAVGRHVRFGGRPHGTGPATASTSPRGRPNRLADASPPPGPRLRDPPCPLRSHDPPRHDRPHGPPPHRREHRLLARPDITGSNLHTRMKQREKTTSEAVPSSRTVRRTSSDEPSQPPYLPGGQGLLASGPPSGGYAAISPSCSRNSSRSTTGKGSVADELGGERRGQGCPNGVRM